MGEDTPSSVQFLQTENSNVVFYIFLTIALMCTAWVLLIKPATFIGPGKSLTIMYITFAFWVIIIPIMMINKVFNEYDLDNREDKSFIIIKGITLIISVFVYGVFVSLLYYGKIKNYKFIFTVSITLLIIINIAEACYKQFKFYGTNNTDVLNIINPIIGIGLIGSLLLNFKQGSLMSIKFKNKNIIFNSGIKIWFILAYTAWNLIFKIQLFPSVYTLIFFGITLLLPLMLQLITNKEWILVRLFTLIFYIIVANGINKNHMLLPIYNEEDDKENIITKIQSNYQFRCFVLIFGIIFLLFSFRESWLQTKTISGIF